MHQKVRDICNALSAIADAMQQQGRANQPDAPFAQHKGWNHPAITPNEIESIPRNIVKKLELANIESLDGLDEKAIEQAPARLKMLQKQNIAYIYNGHGSQAIPAFLITIKWVESLFDPIFNQVDFENPLALNVIKNKIRSMNERVNELGIKEEDLNLIIAQIKSAHEAADSLPSDLADLREARKKISETVHSTKSDIDSAIAVEKSSLLSVAESSQRKLSAIEELFKKAEERSKILDEQTITSKKLLEDSENAYSIAVTKGLSGSFHARAVVLSVSMWFWVLALVLDLFFGVKAGSDRLSTLSALMLSEHPNIELILIQLFLSVLSLGAPIWFAWLATKQISQRFRLAEDYSYKAAVAKAYEGYRREAARIDPVLEAKLLHSSLSRLDEAPLRYVDETYHSTPWQELIASIEFRDAINSIPDLKNRFSDIINRSLPEALKPKPDK
jgi:hypothetical protein